MAKCGPIVINKIPEVSRLEVKEDFNGLTAKEKLYAHHSARYVGFDIHLFAFADGASRAAWNSAPIIMDQTSPESISIFHLSLIHI